MSVACLCGIERCGLAEALVMRGVGVERIGRDAIAGLRPPAGSVLVAAFSAGDLTLGALREAWRGPLMVLLPGGDQAGIARALDAGVDDAATDQASDPLVAARVAALIRRHRAGRLVEFGSLTIDPVARWVGRAGRPIGLLPREYQLLLHLVARSGAVVTRAELREAMLGLAFDPGTNVIEVHVSRLRAKLDRGFDTPMLLTERGRGYRLVADRDSPIEAPLAAR